MKIAFVVANFPTLSETFILNQIIGLLDLGHDIKIFARFDPREEKVHQDVNKYNLRERTHYFPTIPENKIIRVIKAFLLLIKNFTKAPITILRTMNIFRYGKTVLSLKSLFYVIPFLEDKDFDIIQCHFGTNGIRTVFLKDILNAPFVTTFHGYDIRLGLKNGGEIYKKLFEKGDLFIAVCDYNEKSLINFGLDKEKIVRHPIGVDIDRLKYRQNKERNSDTVKIVTVARLVKEKGLEYAIKAVHKILNKNPELSLEYNIVGDGPLREKLQELIKELNLEGKVNLLGSRNSNDVIELLNQSDIFLLSSIAEAFCAVLLEAQAMGLPIVATSVGGVGEAVINGKTGFLVPERNVEALSERLNYLIEHPELWPKFGRSGKKFVEEHFDIKKLNRRLAEIYQSLLQ